MPNSEITNTVATKTKSQLSNEIWRAVKDGDIKAVKQCITEGAEVTAQHVFLVVNIAHYALSEDSFVYDFWDDQFIAPISISSPPSDETRLTILKILIEQGAEVNVGHFSSAAADFNDIRFAHTLLRAKDAKEVLSKSSAPLFEAIRSNKSDVAKLFLQEGVKTYDAVGLAIALQREEILKLLLEFGIEIKEFDLNNSIKRRNTEIVKLLINAGAEIKFSYFRSLFDFKHHHSALDLLLEKANIETVKQALSCKSNEFPQYDLLKAKLAKSLAIKEKASEVVNEAISLVSSKIAFYGRKPESNKDKTFIDSTGHRTAYK
jgi:hypothetical protein